MTDRDDSNLVSLPGSKASDAVGYKRPPVHTRFKPGQSGNPSGRAKGSQNLKTLCHKIMKEEVPHSCMKSNGLRFFTPHYLIKNAPHWRPRKPVYEAAVTYEPNSGSIEVVGDDRESRQSLARTFAREVLGASCGGQPLPLREFSLEILLRPYDFPTDPGDGIESVHLAELRLQPLASQGERLTLECARQTGHTIWSMAADRFGPNSPLEGGWFPTKAKLLIRFHPAGESRRSKVLPLTFTMPHGCDLRDRTTFENMIGQKYLERWQLVRHV